MTKNVLTKCLTLTTGKRCILAMKSYKYRHPAYTLCEPISRSVGAYATKYFSSGASVQHNEENQEGDIIETIAKGDPDKENKLKILMLEVEVLRQSGNKVPDNMKILHWENLLSLKHKSAKAGYLLYLFKNEKSSENRKAKQLQKAQEFEAWKKIKPTDCELYNTYGLSHNTMFHRIYESTINNIDNGRLLYGAQFNQPLILDMSFEKNMSMREYNNMAKQLTYIFSENRINRDPFDIHICSAEEQKNTMRKIIQNIPVATDPCFPMTFHETNYTQVFPKESLIYLTPDCRNDMLDYDHNAIYIVGCIVDKGFMEPLTMAKAKREGIRMVRLPIERYIQWGTGGSKTLTLNQIVNILLDKKAGATWPEAFKHVPRRKQAQYQVDKGMRKLKYRNENYYNRIAEMGQTVANDFNKPHYIQRDRYRLDNPFQKKNPDRKFIKKRSLDDDESLY